MVDLIITDSKHVDVRSAVDYTLDCAWGKEENDFELVVSGVQSLWKDAGIPVCESVKCSWSPDYQRYGTWH